MRKFIILIATIFLFSVFTNAQTNPTPSPSPTPAAKTTKKPTFRATKDQIMQVQKMLKEKGTYAGEADGKMNDPFRASIKTYQKDNGLRQSGTLNKATLEKMSIVLTDKQKPEGRKKSAFIPSRSRHGPLPSLRDLVGFAMPTQR